MEKLYPLSYHVIVDHTYQEFDSDHTELLDSSLQDSETRIGKYIDIPSLLPITVNWDKRKTYLKNPQYP